MSWRSLSLMLISVAASAAAGLGAETLADPPLRTVADSRGILVGGLLAKGETANPQLVNLATTEFSVVTGTIYPTTSFGDFWKAPGEYDQARLDYLDQLVALGRTNGVTVHLHPLVYAQDQFTPAWVKEITDPAELEARLREHISFVVGRYAEDVEAWDVVNEAIYPASGEPGGYRDCHYYRVLGPDFFRICFEAARESDPTATLIYNDYGMESDAAKNAAVKGLLTQFQSAPIDALGWQMHVNLSTALDPSLAWEDRMREIGELGFKNFVTELDIRCPQRTFIAQKNAYKRLLETFLRVPPDRRGYFETWGVSDAQSWLGAQQHPLMWNEEYAKKPAYWGVHEAMQLNLRSLRRLKNVGSGLYLNLRFNVEDGLVAAAALKVNSTHMKWQIVPKGAVYELACKWGGLLLTPATNLPGAPAVVRAAQPANRITQRWAFEPADSDAFRLRNVGSNLYLTGGTGLASVQSLAEGNSAQLWRLEFHQPAP